MTKSKYTEEELKEFREIILKKKSKAEDLIEALKSYNGNGNGTDDTYRPYKCQEEAQASLSKEEVSLLLVRQRKYLLELNQAIDRIDNGSYGVCRKTGKLIPKGRLRAVPNATLSIEAKLNGNGR